MSKEIMNKFKTVLFLYFSVGLLFFTACKNEEIYRITKIQMDEVVNVTDTSAVVFGVLIDIGKGISEYGFCWNTTGSPTVEDEILASTDAEQTGKFTGLLSGLDGGTTYYINVYAKTETSILYGEEKVFTCIKGLPKVQTGEISNIGKASASCQGIISDDGGNTILTKGFIWSKTDNPVLGRLDGFTSDTASGDNFTSELTNLVPDQDFYVRAYATNENGTGYGEVKQIKTLAPESGDLIWANYYGGYNHDESHEACTDADGNLYITGRYLEYTTIGNFTLTSAGGYDIYVAKINSNGTVDWAKSAGGVGDDNSFGICYDNIGNVAITGSFQSSAKFDDTHTLNSAGQSDIFLVKYSTSGEVVWASRAGSAGTDAGYAASSDANGNFYITGTKSGSVTFGLYTLPNYAVFTVKYNNSGVVQWARELNYSQGYAICTDNSSNVFILGRYASGALPGTTYFDIFVAKYNSSGTLQWSPVIDSNSESDSQIYYDAPGAICSDNSGNIYVAGRNSSRDVFLSKYNTSASQLWSKTIKGSNFENVGGITVDDADYLHIIGNSSSPKVAFDTDTVTNFAYTDIFYAKYKSNGDIIDAKGYQGEVDDYGSAIYFSPGYIYLIGYADSRFLQLDYFNIENKGRNDMLIAKVKQ